MKKYILENNDTPKDKVYSHMIKQMKLLVKGVQMLKNVDLHIVQIS